MNKSDTAVVILNWNGKVFLQKFLHTVIRNSKNHARIVVADNGSTDGSVEYLESFMPAIEILRFNNNLGYTGGYNHALEKIKAKYYVLLNSDIEVRKNWLQPALEVMEGDKNIAACQPKIKMYDRPDSFEYAGAAGGYIDFLGYPFCRGRIFNTLENDNGQYDEQPGELFWASGACMFIRADDFHNAGGFDEHFFAHMEEIDLCWRLKSAGKKIMSCSQSTVHHVGGGTLPKTNPRKTFLNFRNNLWVLAKNLPAKKFYTLLPLRLILDMVAAFKFLLNGDHKDFVAIFKAHFAFFKKLSLMRKQSGKNVTNQTISEIYNRSIAWDYFIKKKQYFNELDKKKFT